MKQKNIIAVLNQKGGVGKTTTTINVAAYLAKDKRKVLIVDADPQGNATSGLGIDSRKVKLNLADLLGPKQIASKGAVYKTKVPGLDILPCDGRLASAEVELASAPDRELAMKKALETVSETYDYILIDCPPSLGLLTINVLAASDLVLIPVQAEYYALEGLSQLLQVMQRVKQGINPSLELLGVVITMFDKRTALAQQVYNEVRRHFPDKFFEIVIPRNVRLAEAPSFGRPISDHDKWSKGARAYKKLTKEIIDSCEQK